MCSIYGWSASEGFFAGKARCCKISGRVVKNLWALVSLRRKFSSPVSPTLQAIVHVKTGWIESRYPSIIRASRRTSSAFRVDFPAVTSAELQTQERVILRNQPWFPAPNTHLHRQDYTLRGMADDTQSFTVTVQSNLRRCSRAANRTQRALYR